MSGLNAQSVRTLYHRCGSLQGEGSRTVKIGCWGLCRLDSWGAALTLVSYVTVGSARHRLSAQGARALGEFERAV